MKQYQVDVTVTLSSSKGATLWMDTEGNVILDVYDRLGRHLNQEILNQEDRAKMLRTYGLDEAI